MICYKSVGSLTTISLATSGRTPSQNQICRRAPFRCRAVDLGVWSWRNRDLERWRGGASVRLIKITKTGHSSSSSWIFTNAHHSPSSSVGIGFDIQSSNEEHIADALNWKHRGSFSGICKAKAKSLLWVWSLSERQLASKPPWLYMKHGAAALSWEGEVPKWWSFDSRDLEFS